MKKLKRTYLMAAVALLTAGCSEQDAINQQGRTPVNLGYTVLDITRGQSPCDVTRAATNLNENYLSSGTLMVSVKAHGDADYPDFVAYTGADDGALTPPSEGQFYYPGGTTADIVACYPSETFTGVQTDQTTDAAYLASDLMWAAVENQQATTHMVNLQLRHLMSKIVVNATAGEGLSGINSVKLVNVKPGIASFDPATGAVGDATGDAGAITMTNNGAALIPKQTIDGAFIEIATDLGIATYAVDNKTFLSGYQYTYNITVNYYDVGTTNTIEAWNEDGKVTVTPTAGDDIPNHAPSAVTLVDLGLPSGTLWANMNVGATAVTDYGTYFAWGETAGYTVSGHTSTVVGSPAKTTYNWSTYWWGSSDDALTKYVTEAHASANGKNGFFDNKTVLDFADDAAYVNWGGGWRMPTKEEFQELIDNTTSTWTTVDGVNGYRFTSTASGNTNSIFLPAGGYRFNTTMSNQTGDGYYCSATLDEAYSGNACYLLFSSATLKTYKGDRCVGFTLRPVFDISLMQKNPLWWVAQYNLAQNKTSFVTAHATTSQYLFSWSDAKTANIPGYHHPDLSEHLSVIPYDESKTSGHGTNIFSWTETLANPKEFTEKGCSVGGVSIASSTSIWGKNANSDFYAIRFIGTQYCSAWHYKWVNYPCNGLLIESYLLGGITTLNQAKAKMAEAGFATRIFTGVANASKANQAPNGTTVTSTTVTANAFCQRFLPACGSSTGSGGATGGVDVASLYWCSTPVEESYGFFWYADNENKLMVGSNLQSYGCSVRLFRNY